MKKTPGTPKWTVVASVTHIWANFGDIDPNKELAEINVRESIISPIDTNVNYITIRGFTIMHSANGWGPPSAYQGAAISTNGGHHWIVENCEVINAKTCGFSMGNPRVRRSRAGWIMIMLVSILSEIIFSDDAGNVLLWAQDIIQQLTFWAIILVKHHTGAEFWGHEVAAIKFHNAVDLIIENNYIGNSNNVRALWIDFGNQNIRLSRNIIGVQMFIEMNHGPILIDNNVLEGVYINRGSGAITLAHNLLNFDNIRYTHDPFRKSAYYTAHTRETVMRELSFIRDERWYNNIFIKKGLDSLRVSQPASADIQVTRTTPPPPIQLGVDPLTTNYGCAADYNLYINGSKKHDSFDRNSIVSALNPEFSLKDEDGNVTVSFLMNEDASKINGPLITTDFLGIYEPMKLRMENNDGSPITVDMDILKRPRNKANPGVGPFADLKAGQNSFTVFTISDKGPQVNK